MFIALTNLLKDRWLRDRFIKLVDIFQETLAYDVYPEYMDHTIHHVRRVAQLAFQMVEPIQVGKIGRLSQTEIFILLCAIQFHDIGMQCDDASLVQDWIPKHGDWDELTRHQRGRIVRKHHARIGEAFLNRPDSPFVAVLEHQELIHAVSRLCRAHVLAPNSREYTSLSAGTQFRLSLLSSILRTCDVLDISQERVRNLSSPPPDSWVASRFWTLHKLADNVTIDSQSREICVNFQCSQRECARARNVVDAYMLEAAGEMAAHESLLAMFSANYHLAWDLQMRDGVQPH